MIRRAPTRAQGSLRIQPTEYDAAAAIERHFSADQTARGRCPPCMHTLLTHSLPSILQTNRLAGRRLSNTTRVATLGFALRCPRLCPPLPSVGAASRTAPRSCGCASDAAHPNCGVLWHSRGETWPFDLVRAGPLRCGACGRSRRSRATANTSAEQMAVEEGSVTEAGRDSLRERTLREKTKSRKAARQHFMMVERCVQRARSDRAKPHAHSCVWRCVRVTHTWSRKDTPLQMCVW